MILIRRFPILILALLMACTCAPIDQNTKELTANQSTVVVQLQTVYNASVSVIINNKVHGSATIIQWQDKIVALTAWHVVDDVKSGITIGLLEKEIQIPMAVVAHDKDTDLALLTSSDQITSRGPFVRIGQTRPKIGTVVVVIGSPLGEERLVSAGIIRGYREGKIKVDASIFFGNSGGGVFNRQGELVGVITNGKLIGFAMVPGSGEATDTITINKFVKEHLVKALETISDQGYEI